MNQTDLITISSNGDGSLPPDLTDSFLIVGIGASAGGIPALSEFFSNVEADSGMAYVVILHLSPDHDSQLAHVLQQVAKIPVEQVKTKTEIRPDHVYVVPPDRSLTIKDGHILVKPVLTVEERRAPVDIFFRTLAEARGPNAVGVILSGTGANGSMGQKRIKEMGGTTIVQNPREAEYSDMPRNSIATDLVDAVLPVAEIPGQILQYRDRRRAVKISDDTDETTGNHLAALGEIFTELKSRTGHDFSNYKRATILRRIERRIGVQAQPDLGSYAGYLRSHPEETEALLKDLLISVTNFFRDKKAFQTLENRIMPKLLKRPDSAGPVRIWVAGSATGEEAYSLAMLAIEHTSVDFGSPQVQIFASDIDEQAIAFAREGLYSLNDAADVSPERLHRFFSKEGDRYRVSRELREMILFTQHNVLKDPPFSNVDLISCRNLLIYFNRVAQERVMDTFHFALRPGGYLFVGSSESLENTGDLFTTVDKESHIYQGRETATRRLPLPEPGSSFRVTLPGPDAKATAIDRPAPRITFGELHLRLLEQYAPPSIIVNEKYGIVHISPSAGKYLQVVGGEPTTDLMRMVRHEIRPELRGALAQAAEDRANVQVNNIPVNLGDGTERVDVMVRPVLDDTDTARGFFLILFQPSVDSDGSEQTVPAYTHVDDAGRRLEEELVRSKTQIQAALTRSEVQAEELRASNEELQAMNEELRASSEELETGREELQSVNEELNTVNQELKIKIDELQQINNDFQNLLNSIDIGTVFLDRGFRVNLFSPAARDIFNFRDNDTGRPITDITSRLNYDDILTDGALVLETLQMVEREVRTTDDLTYLMRIYPYRTERDMIYGVVMTFVDITENKRISTALLEAEEQFRRAIEDAPIPIIMHAEDGEVLQISRSWSELTGYTQKEIPTFDAWLTTAYGEGADRVREHVHDLFSGRAKKMEVEFPIRTKIFGERIWNFSASAPGRLQDGRRFIVGMALDITETRAAEQVTAASLVSAKALHASEQRLQHVMESIHDYAILTMDPDGKVTTWNSGAVEILGWTAQEAMGMPADAIFTPEDRAAGAPEFERQTAIRDGRAPDERYHQRKDGSLFYASGVLTLLQDENGDVRGFVKILRDMTDWREIGQALHEKEMLQKLVKAQEDERTRIARDLHDELGQQLTLMRLKLDNIKSLCPDDGSQQQFREIEEIARSVDEGVDHLAWELRPAALDDLGLVAALDKYVKQWSKHSGIQGELIGSSVKRARFASDVETNLYRIVQEALNNTAKHAQAKKVEVMLEKRDGLLVLVIEDDGKGFNPMNKRLTGRGLGLTGMRERAALIGGSLQIESTPKKGTTIFVNVPITARGKQ